MQTAKEEVEVLLHNLPDESTIEDIQYHLYVLEKVRRGRNDVATGKAYSSKEAKEQLQKWLEK